jgi:serine/threonine protein kinase
MSDAALNSMNRAQSQTRLGLLPEPFQTLLGSKKLIQGKYRLEGLLGRGGMSVVFRAEHVILRQPVAIKFLNVDRCEPSAISRFLREGRSIARIRSEHVARVIDVDTVAGTLPYMVLECLHGQDLSQTLQQRGPLPLEQAVDYVMQALEAVAEAHTLNIVHRDLKPSNLFVVQRADGQQSIKVIDFGISKSVEDSDQTAFTQKHSILGSPEYMAPEQALGEVEVDARADLWSIGIVLYELLSGTCPFQGPDYIETLRMVVRDDPPSLAAKCPHLPPQLEAIIGRCLQRDRDKRYQTAGELARALLPFGSQRARMSYDSVVGLEEEAENARAIPVVEDPVPSSDEGARDEWKSVGTAELARAVEEAAFISEDSPDAEATSPRPQFEWTGGDTRLDLRSTQRSRNVNKAPRADSGKMRDAARPWTAHPGSPVGLVARELNEWTDHGGPLITVVEGTVPSVNEGMTTQATKEWIRKPEIKNRKVRMVAKHKTVRARKSSRTNIVLWALTTICTVATAAALLAQSSGTPEPKVESSMIVHSAAR